MVKNKDLVNYEDVTRLEVINHNSHPKVGDDGFPIVRAYQNHAAKGVRVELQDDGRTLKVFI